MLCFTSIYFSLELHHVSDKCAVCCFLLKLRLSSENSEYRGENPITDAIYSINVSVLWDQVGDTGLMKPWNPTGKLIRKLVHPGRSLTSYHWQRCPCRTIEYARRCNSYIYCLACCHCLSHSNFGSQLVESRSRAEFVFIVWWSNNGKLYILEEVGRIVVTLLLYILPVHWGNVIRVIDDGIIHRGRHCGESLAVLLLHILEVNQGEVVLVAHGKVVHRGRHLVVVKSLRDNVTLWWWKKEKCLGDRMLTGIDEVGIGQHEYG